MSAVGAEVDGVVEALGVERDGGEEDAAGEEGAHADVPLLGRGLVLHDGVRHLPTVRARRLHRCRNPLQVRLERHRHLVLIKRGLLHQRRVPRQVLILHLFNFKFEGQVN